MLRNDKLTPRSIFILEYSSFLFLFNRFIWNSSNMYQLVQTDKVDLCRFISFLNIGLSKCDFDFQDFKTFVCTYTLKSFNHSFIQSFFPFENVSSKMKLYKIHICSGFSITFLAIIVWLLSNFLSFKNVAFEMNFKNITTIYLMFCTTVAWCDGKPASYAFENV